MTEKTLEREEEVDDIQHPEADVLDHLEEVEQREELASQRWDAETTAEITDITITDDPELLKEADIRLPEEEIGHRYEEQAKEVLQLRQDLSNTIDSDAGLVQSPRVVEIEAQLPNGNSFTDVFHLPRTTADCEFADLCDALGVVPGVDETLVGRHVPVEQVGSTWKVHVPEEEDTDTTSSQPGRPLLELSVATLYSIAAVTFLTGLFVVDSILPLVLGSVVMVTAKMIEREM